MKPAVASWPPPYTVRISKRARYARLQLSPDGELTVALPQGMAPGAAHEVLDAHRAWVEKHMRQAPVPTAASELLPDTIHLPAIGAMLAVRYQATDRNTVYIGETEADILSLQGRVDDARNVRAALQYWLKQKAKGVLEPWLRPLSRELGLPYQKLTVRLQRGRWGSCSSNGGISLNAKLLLIEPVLVRHVMVHELCHTVHMNHSTAFWDLVARHDPDWAQLRKACRERWRNMPAWVST